jgi:hypothetical protein
MAKTILFVSLFFYLVELVAFFLAKSQRRKPKVTKAI